MPELVTQAEFARINGFSRAYVTKLKHMGRLVFVGKLVSVDESRAMIGATRDPNRDDVSRRHAMERTPETPGDRPAPVRKPPPKSRQDEENTESQRFFQAHRAKKEKYAALSAQAAYEKEVGLLVEKIEVIHAAAAVSAIYRSGLEGLPDQISADLVTVTDQNEIHAILVESFEELLESISHKIEKLEISDNEQ